MKLSQNQTPPKLDSDHQEDDIQQMEQDSDDCIIEKVLPPPENIDKPEASTPEAPPPHMPNTKAQLKFFPDGAEPQILLQLPYGTKDRFYTLTTISETQTMKRHRQRDNSPRTFYFYWDLHLKVNIQNPKS